MAQKARRKGWQAPMRVAHHLQLRAALTFFYQLPIALERSDLRLIHACWSQDSIQALPKLVGSWSTLFARYRRNSSADLKAMGWTRKRVGQLKAKYPLSVGPPEVEEIPYLPDLSEYFSLEQNLNPLRVLTQGLYGPLMNKTPFWSGYRWQMSDRIRWLNDYNEEIPVIFGHYWRSRYQDLKHNHKPSLFAGIEANEFLGAQNNCFCLDFAVGLRYQERLAGASEYQGSLAALRVPEEGSLDDWELVFDDGTRYSMPSPQKTGKTKPE
jgi:hypothetical protein